MNINYLDFEQPIADLLAHIEELKRISHDSNSSVDLTTELNQLEKKNLELTKKIFSSLSDWQISQLSRHPMRPYTLDYVERIFTDFHELAGDRAFADDKAIVGGLARLNGRPVMIIGHQKGRDIRERTLRNFGMPRPEGYRKAMRLMDLAQRFSMPVLTFVDTAGAFPGIDAEERGQGQAISDCIEKCLSLNVPLIATVIGEGGIGGAVALAAANKVLMLEYSIYSVISPEGCAAILWKDREKAPLAAKSLKMTAADLSALGIIDEIIKEPLGAAHRNYSEVMRSVSDALERNLEQMQSFSGEYIKNMRRDKFMKMTIIH